MSGKWEESQCLHLSPRNRIIHYRIYYCSVCGKSNGRKKTNFCSNCGADMRERKEDDNDK